MKNKIIIVAVIVFLALVLYGANSGWFVSKPASNLPGEQAEEQAAAGETPINPPEIVDIFYTSSFDKAQYGNFSFRYPSALILDKSEVVEGSSGEKHHVVVLKDRYGIAPDAKIEINVPRKTCEDYAVCKIISRVATSTPASNIAETITIVIGTDSEDDKLLGWFGEIVDSFQVFPSPTVPVAP